MKRCTKCGQLKPKSEFHKDKYTNDGLGYRCKECVRNYRKVNRDKILVVERRYIEANRDKITLRKHNRQIEHTKFVNSLKTPCVKCGETREYIIDFHHINPSNKEFTIGATKQWGRKRLMNEVKKCISLCRNCHSEFHHLYGKQPKQPIESLNEYLGGDNYGIQL